MKHTPGPWHCCDYRIGRQDGARIADTWSSAIPRDEQVANARLIAAAPTMLGALKDCLEAWQTSGYSNGAIEFAKESARAAIAKAEDAS